MSDYYWSNGGLRRDTGESIEYVLKYLKDNKEYGYVYTTGRWSTYKGKEVKHYHSKGIEDFDTNYLNKFVKENNNEDN